MNTTDLICTADPALFAIISLLQHFRAVHNPGSAEWNRQHLPVEESVESVT